jgi:hypothetical protein
LEGGLVENDVGLSFFQERDSFNDNNDLMNYAGQQYPFDGAPLLKRHYYSLDMAAHKLGWSVENLLHYGATGQVEVVFCTQDEPLIVAYEFFDEESEYFHEIEAFGTQSYRWRGAFFVVGQIELSKIELHNEVHVEKINEWYLKGLVEGFIRDDVSYCRALYKFDVPLKITKSNLFIMACEIQRIIKGVPRPKEVKQVEIEKPVNTPFAVVGVMLEMLIEGKDGNGVPLRTASKTQDVIAEAVETFAPKYENRTGLAKKTVEGIFARANKYLDSRKA